MISSITTAGSIRGDGRSNDIILSNLGLAVSRGLAVIARIPVIPALTAPWPMHAGWQTRCGTGGQHGAFASLSSDGESKYQRMKVPIGCRLRSCMRICWRTIRMCFLSRGLTAAFSRPRAWGKEPRGRLRQFPRERGDDR